MNGTWFNWGAQARANPAAYRGGVEALSRDRPGAGRDERDLGLVPQRRLEATSTPLASLYPGDAYVDWTLR